jgi:hypothetical protein
VSATVWILAAVAVSVFVVAVGLAELQRRRDLRDADAWRAKWGGRR